jgi:site-specific DNA-methyltransferase (adenine-specific)
MAVYYQDDYVTLYHGDCLEQTAWLDADVLITDPPYGTHSINGNTRGGYGRRNLHDKGDGVGFSIANDDTTEFRDTVLKLWGNKPALVFGSPRLPDPPGQWADRLVWDKKRLGMNGGAWRYQHESIYVTAGFVRVDDSSSSIITAFPIQDEHIHAKPLPLMESLIAKAPEGLIADPFAGSGSTLVAARNLGRKAVGIELEEKYCELIVKRLAQQTFDFGDY